MESWYQLNRRLGGENLTPTEIRSPDNQPAAIHSVDYALLANNNNNNNKTPLRIVIVLAQLHYTVYNNSRRAQKKTHQKVTVSTNHIRQQTTWKC
jgi:hypothetical protein